MLYLKQSQSGVCTGAVNLGVTDVKATKAIGMGKITQKQNAELIKVRVFDSFVRHTNTRRLSNIYLRRDDRSGRKSKRLAASPKSRKILTSAKVPVFVSHNFSQVRVVVI